MAKIVLAMVTTHGPQLHTSVEQWQLLVKAEKNRKHPFRNGVYSFDALVVMRSLAGTGQWALLVGCKEAMSGSRGAPAKQESAG